MSEIITASIIEKPVLSSDEYNVVPYSSETITKLEVAILTILEANNIDKDSVLFAGYNADDEKLAPSRYENQSNRLPIFFFGNAMSLAPPDSLWDDEGDQEEQWFSNPIQFASSKKDYYGPHGRIGVYDKNLIHTIAKERPNGLGFHETGPDQFGTYSYALSPEELESAQIIEIELRDRVRAHFS